MQHVENAARIDTEIMGKLPNLEEYYFPDNIYNDDELCTMLFMFSHVFLNNSRAIQYSARVRRATYQYQGSKTSNPAPINSAFLDGAEHLNPIQEKGIVSFRLDSKEAIAPAKVLIGIIAGMTDTVVTSGKAITQKVSGSGMTEDVTLKDPILAVTLGSQMGTASFYEFSNSNNGIDQNLIFGAQGSWINTTCCTYYAIEGVTDPRALRRSSRGSLAQVRGALDGYIIGKNLKNNIGRDAQQLKLSTILKSYYSWPHITTGSKKYGLSYCDRRDNRPNSQDVVEVGNTYSQIYNYAFTQENSMYKGDLINTYVDRAASNLQEFCNKRSTGTLDKNSPLDTPADLIFIVDPKSEEMSKTAELINAVISRVNKIGRYAGAVSVFANSNSKTEVLLPGTAGWPLAALVYNSTNIGAVGCRLNTNSKFWDTC